MLKTLFALIFPRAFLTCSLDTGGGGGAPAPDPGIGQAALTNAAISKEALDWYKQQYADGAGDRARASDVAQKNSTADLALKNQQLGIATETNDYYKKTFKPLEQSIVDDANAYDTPERRAQNVSAAMAGVDTQLSSAKEQALREAAARGVDPTSGNFIASQGLMDVNGAAAKAAAGNKAIIDTETMGAAKKMDAASLGRNLATNQTAQASSAIQAGQSALNSAISPTQVSNAAAATMGTGFGTAIQGNSSAGNLLAQQYQGQMAQYNANQSGSNSALGALGGIAGQFAGSAAGSGLIKTGIMAMSDEDMKEDIVPTEPEDALQAVKDTPVAKWRYKPGAADGGTHVGPMAQDVQASMGDEVAPGGKQIDLISMNGITMAAIQALDKKVTALAKKQGVAA